MTELDDSIPPRTNGVVTRRFNHLSYSSCNSESRKSLPVHSYETTDVVRRNIDIPIDQEKIIRQNTMASVDFGDCESMTPCSAHVVKLHRNPGRYVTCRLFNLITESTDCDDHTFDDAR